MPSQKEILIIEDNDLNRMILREILEGGAYRVTEAANGQEALELLAEKANDIDLILLDVIMPVLDGYGFLDRVKDDPVLSLIPVIVMTQSGSEEDEVMALSHGATDFVPKPYRPQVILHRIASIIKLRDTAAIANQLMYDRLTGLYTKDYFCRLVNERLQGDGEYSVIALNIENFKLYNDTHGIAMGDELLKETARELEKAAGPEAICGRYGADRFLCFQTREKEVADRRIFQEGYRGNLSDVVMKWGIYEISDRTISAEQIADRALLAADSIKGQYSEHFALYSDTLREKLVREKEITDAMEKALEEEQFRVYLQPKYSLSTNTMAGAEALVRWIHPEWGFMSPGEFIPLFEKNGFITKLDFWVFEKVCSLLGKWKDEGIALLPVSVNISRKDIFQPDIVDKLTGLTRQYGIEPELVHIEITESAYSDQPAVITETVDRLRAKGFIIEMDDFGSGYSSLNMLNELRIDILKLDMKFIQSEMGKSAGKSILRFIINLAHWMGLSVVAEGVETAEQVQRLRLISCDYVQGFFFSRPLPEEDFHRLLKTHSGSYDLHMSLPEEEKPMSIIVVADEDDAYRKKVRKTFEGDYAVRDFATAAEAAAFLEEKNPAVAAVIVSHSLPGGGFDTIMKLMKEDPYFWKIPVLASLEGGIIHESLLDLPESDDFLCKFHPQADLKRRVNHLIAVAGIQERKILLEEEASRDYLTGLLNRRGLQLALSQIRRDEMPVALLLFDLDDLKKINDTHGHEKGDLMLRTFSDIVRKQTRAYDITCRYGGDEFLIILKRIKDGCCARAKAESICSAFRTTMEENGLSVSASCGIVTGSEDEAPSQRMIAKADRALYSAKRENKGSVRVFQ